MTYKSWLKTSLEMAVIVSASALFGIAWNRTLLADAWRGAPAGQATPVSQQVAPGSQQAEVLPMPIALAQVKELHDSGQAVLVDARSTASFAKEHIAGARSLPLEEASRQATPQLNGVAKDSIIIAYCNGFSCHDSMELGKLLIKAGYGSVYVFEGGLPEWRDGGYPTSGGKR